MSTASVTITPTARPSDYVKAHGNRKFKNGVARLKVLGMKKGAILYNDTNTFGEAIHTVLERSYKESIAAGTRRTKSKHANVRHQPRKLRAVTAMKIVTNWKAQLEHDQSRIGRDDAIAQLLLEKLEAMIEYGESLLLATTKGAAITRKERVV